ncbi:hypothetical protein PGT21_014380 [Puccinia graminis f. sp. tritici]|uniref:Uncharacterized protein n=1 Tax=Puccinia graminis f. sp. tritici TaxID=56615 RepID=A0A5B0Q5Q8_PUCGR|nr:hypothetical protein PGT21_014380 [Puccinia graminis f. sp. tritici]
MWLFLVPQIPDLAIALNSSQNHPQYNHRSTGIVWFSFQQKESLHPKYSLALLTLVFKLASSIYRSPIVQLTLIDRGVTRLLQITYTSGTYCDHQLDLHLWLYRHITYSYTVECNEV